MLDLTPAVRNVSGRPAKFKLVFGSLFVGFVWNSLPWNGEMLVYRPDALLLVMIFWTVHEPDRVGLAIAFVLGLLMDVAGSAYLGVHALTYVVAIYGIQALRVRVLKFRLHEQALHILVILAIERLLALIVGLIVGQGFPGLGLLVAPVVGAITWIPLSVLLFHRVLRGERRTFG
jgi:rod shape-determining protein MreD